MVCSDDDDDDDDNDDAATAISTLSKDLPVDESPPELMAEDQTLSIQEA